MPAQPELGVVKVVGEALGAASRVRPAEPQGEFVPRAGEGHACPAPARDLLKIELAAALPSRQPEPQGAQQRRGRIIAQRLHGRFSSIRSK